MKLARVKIDGFRCLAGLDWRPAPGLNLVLGPNEAGKSSLADFLEAMIFGLGGGAETARSAPFSGGAFGGRLELDCDGKLAVIERDFATGRFFYVEADAVTGRGDEPLAAELRRGSTGPVFKRYRELLTRHIGFFDEVLFRKSVFVPQGELGLARQDLPRAAEALRTLAAGGGAAFDRALAGLLERCHDLTAEGDQRRKPGVLDGLRAEKDELTAALKELAVSGRRAAELRADVEKRATELEQVRAEAQETGRLAGLLRERLELSRRRAALAAADEAVRAQLAAAEAAERALAEQDRRLAAYADLAAAGAEFPQLVSRVRGAREKADRLGAEADARRAEREAGRVPAWPLWAGVGLLAASIAGLAGWFLGADWLLAAAGGVFAAAGATLALRGLFVRSRAAAAQARVGQELSRLEAELARARAELERASAALMAQTGGRVDFAPGAMDALLRRYGERLDLAARRAAAAAARTPPKKVAELREQLAGHVRELAVIDARLEKLDADLGGLAAAGDQALAALPAKAAKLDEHAGKLAAELKARELELAAAGGSDLSEESARERIEELEVRIAAGESRCRALRLAHAELAASIQEFQESHLERLGGLAGAHLAALTAGRHKAVRIEGESLRPLVSGALREGLDEESLSQGTRAALYLALRLALGELLAGGRPLPIILDDPLVDLDDERRAAALELLKRLAGRAQVILLASDRRLAVCGAAALELPKGGAP